MPETLARGVAPGVSPVRGRGRGDGPDGGPGGGRLPDRGAGFAGGIAPGCRTVRSPSGGERDRTIGDSADGGRCRLYRPTGAANRPVGSRIRSSRGRSRTADYRVWTESDIMGNRRVYRGHGHARGHQPPRGVARAASGRILTAPSLQVDRPQNAAAPVIVEAVTPEQAAGIVAQNSTEASIETAAGYAVMNRMAKTMPGGEVRSLIPDDPGSSVRRPQHSHAASRPDRIRSAPRHPGAS